MSSYYKQYYASHRYELRMKAFITRAYARKDTQRYYLQIARKMEPLVKKEREERLRNQIVKKKVPKPELKKRAPKKAVTKYKITDDDCFIVKFD
jgi:hypothetical protein